ncbi:four helix bundle protein [Mucilaginibacter sp. SP1R1]|uniref:four helix bundle protein n=1 Tax=Mucilaginibacter sp. SP1R1 TaxID=2723091 RepID=UPI0016083FC8|nr:four helix bundle protein [Mucilaginibacter sp. SP1R1]MBB6151607.1 four helix bundle protein [Mucilaginibacter sp. SP1R1]
MHNFKELKVWKAGIEISKIVFQLSKTLPSEEKYGLISQLIRSAISIPSNIAEGCGRGSNKELHRFLSIALGSSFELETQLIIVKEFNYISQQKLEKACAIITDIQKMVYGLQKSLNT